MRPLIVRTEAEADIEEAFRWYEEQSPGLGAEFVRVVDAALSAIGRNPGHEIHGDPRAIATRRTEPEESSGQAQVLQDGYAYQCVTGDRGADNRDIPPDYMFPWLRPTRRCIAGEADTSSESAPLCFPDGLSVVQQCFPDRDSGHDDDLCDTRKSQFTSSLLRALRRDQHLR